MYQNIQFEQLRPSDLEKIVREKPIAWIPVGTLEWHGKHLPVGLDALKAHALCVRIARKAGGVVLPPDYFSILGLHFPWTFKYSPDILVRSMLTTLRRLHSSGFKTMFIITGHYPVEQVVLMMLVADIFMSFRDAVVVALPEFAMGMDDGYNGDHAAKWETSIMMELFPELVDGNELERLSDCSGFDLFRGGIYGANPAYHASRKTGSDIIDTMVGNFAGLAEKICEDHDKAIARDIHKKTMKNFIKNETNRFFDIFRMNFMK